MAALGAVIGLGVLGGRTAEPTDRAVRRATAAPTMTVPWAIAVRRSPIVELVVRGRVGRDVGPVAIRLETANGALIDTEPADPIGQSHGGWVPFETRFHVSPPGPGHDSGWFVVAVGADGTQLGGARRPFSASRFLDVTDDRARPIAAGASPGPVASPRPRSIGNDGLVGGIVFGVPMAERH